MDYSPDFQYYISSYSCAFDLQTIFKTLNGTNLNAVRYSTSPIGGSKPPVQAIFMLYPSPGPLPTWKTEIKCQKERKRGKRRRKRGRERGKEKKSQMCFRNKHQTTCQISLVWQGLLWVMHLFSTGPLLPVDNLVIWCNLKNQRRTRKLGVIMQRNYLKDTNKNGALKK